MNEVSLIGYHGFNAVKGKFYIKFKNERVNKIELRTCNCTICSVYNPQKHIKFNKIIKKGVIVWNFQKQKK